MQDPSPGPAPDRPDAVVRRTESPEVADLAAAVADRVHELLDRAIAEAAARIRTDAVREPEADGPPGGLETAESRRAVLEATAQLHSAISALAGFNGAADPPADAPASPAPFVEDRSAGQGHSRTAYVDPFDGAKLVALQMAGAGHPRAEVDEHLRHAFGLHDPSSILDEVFRR